MPPPRRLSRVALAASAALHLLLFATLTIEGRPPRAPLVLRPIVSVIELPPYDPARPMPRLPTPAAATRRGVTERPGAAVAAQDRGDTSVAATPAPPDVPVAEATRPDSGPAVAGRIGPGLARGKLWVPALPLPPRELAQRLSRSHTELVDSAVTEVVQAFLDSIANDPRSQAVQLPSWTTTIAGTKFGLDSKYLYIAGLKIPAAVLALLPIPATGNELRAFDRSGQMYEDLHRAARRAENVAEFKDAIREIRERREREREFERNQRTEPDREERLTPDR